jgi:hypothetical protein
MTVSVERALATRLQGRREHLLVAFRVALWTDTRRDEILPLKKEELNFTDMPVIRELDGDKYEAPACQSEISSRVIQGRSRPQGFTT